MLVTNLTEVGLEFIKSGENIFFTRMEYGNGWYQIRDGVPIRKTALVSPQISIPIIRSTYYRDKIQAQCSTGYCQLKHGFLVSEFGVYGRVAGGEEKLLIYDAVSWEDVECGRCTYFSANRSYNFYTTIYWGAI